MCFTLWTLPHQTAHIIFVFQTKPPSAAVEVKKEDGDIFADEEPKKKKSPKKKPKGRTDEELFGNTDDIFGDIPPSTGKSPKTKKKKKKTAAASGEGGALDTPDGGATEGKCTS